MRKPMPYKIVDRNGRNRFGIVVSSLEELVKRAREKFGITGGIKILLEDDGTEVDEEEYFASLQPDTSFVILNSNETWLPSSEYKYLNAYYNKDNSDSTTGRDLVNLMNRLRSDAGQISVIGGKNLEILAEIDSTSLDDLIIKRKLLEEMKEANDQYLNNDTDEEELMNIYQESKRNASPHKCKCTKVDSSTSPYNE